MRLLRQQRGQFIPISAMIMFTMVVFLIALVNVYKVARLKLQLQNIADAAALNLASQQAQAFNLVYDKNEWLNHMVTNVPSAMDPNDPSNRNCEKHGGDPSNTVVTLPGVFCVENTYPVPVKGMRKPNSNHAIFKRHVFQSRDGAINYAQVIHTVNQAQILFVRAYNSFLGTDAGRAPGMGAASRNFTELMKNDIPELADGSVRLLAWNSNNGEGSKESWKKNAASNGTLSSIGMEKLKFKVERDLQIRYLDARDVNPSTLGKILYECISYDPGRSDYGKCGPLHGTTPDPELGTEVGWLVPANMPELDVNGNNQWGVGVIVEKKIKLPVIADVPVRAESRAYIVKGQNDQSRAFRPTYWVKLGN